MSRYKFSNEERYAVFTAHRERCWICDKPVSLNEVQIDHIVPERLEGDPELADVLRQLGCPEGFQINSFENWMPAHGACNRRKAGRVFSPTPLIQLHLELAAERAAKARQLHSKYGSDRRIYSAIQELLVALERGTLSAEHKGRLATVIAVLHEENRLAEDRGKPLLLAPWLEIVSGRDGFLYLRGPSGMVGIRPKGENLHPSWNCPRCGITGWNGVRCVTCGIMDDGD